MIHDKLKKLSDNGIFIKPMIKYFKFAVGIEDVYRVIYNKKITVGKYKHTTRTINKALENMVNYCVDKVTNK